MADYTGLTVPVGGTGFNKLITHVDEAPTEICAPGQDNAPLKDVFVYVDNFSLGPDFTETSKVRFEDWFPEPDFIAITIDFRVSALPSSTGCGAPLEAPSIGGFPSVANTGSGPDAELIFSVPGFYLVSDNTIMELGGRVARVAGAPPAYAGDPSNPDLKYLWRPDEIRTFTYTARIVAHRVVVAPARYSVQKHYYVQPDIDYVIPVC